MYAHSLELKFLFFLRTCKLISNFILFFFLPLKMIKKKRQLHLMILRLVTLISQLTLLECMCGCFIMFSSPSIIALHSLQLIVNACIFSLRTVYIFSIQNTFVLKKKCRRREKLQYSCPIAGRNVWYLLFVDEVIRFVYNRLCVFIVRWCLREQKRWKSITYTSHNDFIRWL